MRSPDLNGCRRALPVLIRDIKVLWTLELFAGGFSIDIKVFQTLEFAGGFSIDIKVFQTLVFQRQDLAILPYRGCGGIPVCRLRSPDLNGFNLFRSVGPACL